MWLCGLLVSGELFLWNRDKDLLKTAAAVPEVVHMIMSFQGMYNSLMWVYVTSLSYYLSILMLTLRYVDVSMCFSQGIHHDCHSRFQGMGCVCSW